MEAEDIPDLSPMAIDSGLFWYGDENTDDPSTVNNSIESEPPQEPAPVLPAQVPRELLFAYACVSA